MWNRLVLTYASVLMLTSSVVVAAGKEAPRVVPSQQLGVGRLVPNLNATDVSGKAVALDELCKKHALVVVAMTSTSCPISKKYLPTLAAFEREFAGKKVAFVFVNVIASDEPKSITNAITEQKLNGHYIHDTKGVWINGLDARTTAECFVLDARRTLLYRGAVDDQYGLGYNLAAAKQNFLKNVLDASLGKKVIEIEATTAHGCEVDKPKTVETGVSTVTYHNRISRIIAAQCQECHREGGVGPFPLETFAQVVAHKAMIRKVVDAGTMPPWHAAEEKTYPGKWANDRSLTPNDKADLLGWIKNGTTEGNAADAPLPRVYPGEWQINTPELVVKLPKPIDIPATGTMPYQFVTIDANITEDKWLQSYEIQPTDRSVVHHVLVHLVLPTDQNFGAFGQRLQNQLAERRGPFAAYVPGNAALTFPVGNAKKLPKGSKFIFQIHYTPNGTKTQEQLRIGMNFAKAAPEREVKVTAVANPRISIPPMAEDHIETALMRAQIPENAYITAFMPHTHVRGKKCKYELIAKDGTVTTLLDVPHYDFNWQLRYELVEPLKITPGSKIRFTVHYDNSPNNPANPDPKKTVTWGDQTTEEMMLGYIEFYIAATPSNTK